jgi:catechol 2,3-dioxygenase-like lactoylglutathione lyase family enzyme
MPKTAKVRRAPARKTARAPRPAKKISAPKNGIRPQPLIAVRDVKASTRWYAKLLGVTELGIKEHAHIYQRFFRDGSFFLQLHAWDEEEHPNLVNANLAPVGHGVLLWFEVDDFDAAVKRARSLKVTFLLEPHVNPAPQHREMWIRDPDGYVVVIASPDGEA